MSQRIAIVKKAQEELGYVEGPADNQTKYQKTNQAWCGAFCNWVFKKVGVSLPDCTSTLAGANAFKKMKRWQDAETATPEPGDVLFFDFPGDGVDRISHIGIVTFVDAEAGIVKAIEGNTSGEKKKSTDERNGGEVALKVRAYKKANSKKLPVFVVGFGKPEFTD